VGGIETMVIIIAVHKESPSLCRRNDGQERQLEGSQSSCQGHFRPPILGFGANRSTQQLFMSTCDKPGGGTVLLDDGLYNKASKSNS
jgi:hypothetical protein